MAGDQEKEVSKKFLENGHKSQMTEEAYLRELNKIKRYFIGLLVLVVIAFLILTILFSVLFANLKYDVENHSHPTKVGKQMSNTLEKEELCLPCDEVRLGPSYEEDRALNIFVRKPPTETDPEQCCVETPTQLLKMLQLFVERKYREEFAHGDIKIPSSTTGEGTAEVPSAHLMGSVRRADQPTMPGRQFPVSQWISDEDLAFTNRVQYRHGRIVIRESGVYYVYSQVSFLEVFDVNSNHNEDTGSQSLSHYLYRYNIIYPKGGEESMIQNSITKCWDNKKAFGEYTSYLGAVFYLRQGDELFVKVSNLTLMVREPKLNYFGLFKIN